MIVLVAMAAATAGAAPFTLRSPAFAAGARMPDNTVLNGLDCGANVSPALAWEHPPKGTKSFVLVLDDYEARGGDGFIHWALYDIPASRTSLPANAGAAGIDIPAGGRHAHNDSCSATAAQVSVHRLRRRPAVDL